MKRLERDLAELLEKLGSKPTRDNRITALTDAESAVDTIVAWV